MNGAIERFGAHKWAPAELCDVLMRSEIKANAVNMADNKDLIIPAEKWQHLLPVVGEDGRTELEFGGNRYTRVTFPSADIIAYWPEEDVLERRLPYKKGIKPMTLKSHMVELAVRDIWPNGIEIRYYLSRRLRNKEIKDKLEIIFPGEIFHSDDALSKMIKRVLLYLFEYDIPPN